MRQPDLDAEIHPHPCPPTEFGVRQSRAGHARDGRRDRPEYA
jgi:hypothetical protein